MQAINAGRLSMQAGNQCRQAINACRQSIHAGYQCRQAINAGRQGAIYIPPLTAIIFEVDTNRTIIHNKTGDTDN
jgi:hypothetical protein